MGAATCLVVLTPVALVLFYVIDKIRLGGNSEC